MGYQGGLPFLYYFSYFEGFTSIPTALTANDKNRRIQVYQASEIHTYSYLKPRAISFENPENNQT